MHLKPFRRSNKILLVLPLLAVVAVTLALLAKNLRPRPVSPSPSTSKIALPTIAPQKSSLTPFSLRDINVVSIQTLFGINEKFQLVKRVGEKDQIVDQDPVEIYAVSLSKIAYIKKSSPGRLFILDQPSGKSSIVAVDSYSQIISLSLSRDENFLFFLANFNPVTRKSILFQTPLAKFSPEKVTSTTANKIESVKNDLLLLYEFSDAPNSSQIQLLKSSSPSPLFSTTANYYFISPTGENLLIQRPNSATLYALSDLSSQTLIVNPTDKIGFLSDKYIAVFQNTYPDIRYTTIDTSTRFASPPIILPGVKNTSIKRILKIIDALAFVEDTDGNLWKIQLSVPAP